jgi:hypothetical protein
MAQELAGAALKTHGLGGRTRVRLATGAPGVPLLMLAFGVLSLAEFVGGRPE